MTKEVTAPAHLAKPEPTPKQVAMPFMLPYDTHVSLAPLIEVIEQKAQVKGGVALLAQSLLDRLQEVPALRRAVLSQQDIEAHSELIEMLLSFVVPAGTSDQLLIKVAKPFSSFALYESPALLHKLSQGKITFRMNQEGNSTHCATLVRAAVLILNKFYGQELEIDPPLLVTIHENESALPKYYKAQLNLEYLDIRHKGELPLLTQEAIDGLLTNIYDTEHWLQTLPPDKFEFHGFMIVTLNDITEEEALSQIKHHLLKRDAVLDRANVHELEQLLRVYLNVPDLQLGITAIDYPKDRAVAHQYKIRFDFLADEIPDLLDDAYANSLYDKVCRFRELMLVEDLTKKSDHTPLEEALLARGIRSLLLATLTDGQDNVIGLVELGSPRAYGLHSFIELQFREILGLFRTAVRRSREEVDNQIEAIIREQYTAIHPSVEWRFVEEAFHLLESRDRADAAAKAGQIVFSNVHPLYGQADIVGSSHQRNEAIRADLTTELQLLLEVLDKGSKQLAFPLLDRAKYDVGRELQHLGDTYNSSDETRILDLVQQRVQPLLRQLAREHQELAEVVRTYFAQLDPELGILYQKRKAYEQSVEKVNDLIGCYLDHENAKMQAVLPHYFERYKTDGVEYDLYLGQSLLRTPESFSDIHLQNFRLWQLIQMCEITRKVEQARAKWPVPLTTAQLIFAYTSSLSIRFRMDEKRFDVDGAYNVRYEILKKRIDKAVIAGSDERITQSGHIAIIYLQEKDRLEYLQYADYLLHRGYITELPKDYELAPLQGVQGLKALRLEVKV